MWHKPSPQVQNALGFGRPTPSFSKYAPPKEIGQIFAGYWWKKKSVGEEGLRDVRAD